MFVSKSCRSAYSGNGDVLGEDIRCSEIHGTGDTIEEIYLSVPGVDSIELSGRCSGW